MATSIKELHARVEFTPFAADDDLMSASASAYEDAALAFVQTIISWRFRDVVNPAVDILAAILVASLHRPLLQQVRSGDS
jgi:hypothetical protein